MSDSLENDHVAQIAMLLEVTEQQQKLIDSLITKLDDNMSAWSTQQSKHFTTLHEHQAASLEKAARNLNSAVDDISPQIRRSVGAAATDAASTIATTLKTEVAAKISPYIDQINSQKSDAIKAGKYLGESLKEFKPKVFGIMAAVCGVLFLVFCLGVFGLMSWNIQQAQNIRAEKAQLKADLPQLQANVDRLIAHGGKVQSSTCLDKDQGKHLCVLTRIRDGITYPTSNPKLWYVIPEGY
jgi:exonuclease VII large subunit